MKSILVALFALYTSQVFAADLNLNGGESAVIEANVRTRVTCGGSSSGQPSCSEVASGFKRLLEACQETYGGGYCASKYWANFKAQNPNCAYAGTPYCLEACQKTYGGGYCADACN